MARIVCLANSYKRSDRCIAGIDLETNRWIRPIGHGYEGAIGGERIINGVEPELLDILHIPIGPLAADHGCQPENMVLETGRWSILGKMSKQEVLKFVEKTGRYLLHNRESKVALSEFTTSIPQNKWKSLQLIQVQDAHFCNNPWGKLECTFKYKNILYRLKATCPEADQCVNKNGNYLLTISMGGPYRRNPEDELYCWKMVAGVIALDNDGDQEVPF